jgi:hypothetical protein
MAAAEVVANPALSKVLRLVPTLGLMAKDAGEGRRHRIEIAMTSRCRVAEQFERLGQRPGADAGAKS